MENHHIKGKKNRLLLGEKVQATPEMVDWYARHFVWSYGAPAPEGQGYSKGEKEIRFQDLASVYVWSLARISGKCPRGITKHYGAEADEPGKKCIWVEFTFKTELGDIAYRTYVDEKNLKSLKRKRKKK
jgi:hypothetical protein